MASPPGRTERLSVVRSLVHPPCGITILSTITSHLRDDAHVPWRGRDLDFTGSTFDGGRASSRSRCLLYATTTRIAAPIPPTSVSTNWVVWNVGVGLVVSNADFRAVGWRKGVRRIRSGVFGFPTRGRWCWWGGRLVGGRVSR